MMAALSYLLFIASNLPVLGGFVALLAPVPLTLVTMRHGVRRAMLSCACATVLVLIAGGGPPQAYLFLMIFGLTGLASGWMLRRAEPQSIALMKATVLLMIPFTPMTLMAGKVVGAEESLEALTKQMFGYLQSWMGSNPDPMTLAQLELLKRMTATMLVCPISVMVVCCLGSLYLNHVVMRFVAPRLRLEVPEVPHPYHLRMPPWLPILMLALFARFNAVGGLNTRFENAVLFNLIVLGFYGIWAGGVAAAARMLSPKKPLLAGHMMGLAVLGFLFQAITVILGLFDAFQEPPAPAAKVAE